MYANFLRINPKSFTEFVFSIFFTYTLSFKSCYCNNNYSCIYKRFKTENKQLYYIQWLSQIIVRFNFTSKRTCMVIIRK